jgi:hypothetical protein
LYAKTDVNLAFTLRKSKTEVLYEKVFFLIPLYVLIFSCFRYTLMLQCWSKTPDMRPSFAEIVSHLDSVICRTRVYVDFTSLKPNYSFPPTEQQAEVPTNTTKQSK